MYTISIFILGCFFVCEMELSFPDALSDEHVCWITVLVISLLICNNLKGCYAIHSQILMFL